VTRIRGRARLERGFIAIMPQTKAEKRERERERERDGKGTCSLATLRVIYFSRLRLRNPWDGKPRDTCRLTTGSLRATVEYIFSVIVRFEIGRRARHARPCPTCVYFRLTPLWRPFNHPISYPFPRSAFYIRI